jgi:glycosyltransferase involved in cell wall biosynthesis
MKLIIDACTQGSGGGKRHLIEVLAEFVKPENKFTKIYIWAPRKLIDILPNDPIIIKNSPRMLNMGILASFFWQFFFRDREFNKIDFGCIYSPYGNYIGKLKPYVTMSRNMLMFEEKERKKFGYSFSRVKLKLLYFVQTKSFLNSSGLIFLSNYAKNIISKKLNNNFKSSIIINHGVSSEFRKSPKTQNPISKYSINNPFKLLYVSNILPYKYHLNVIESVNNLVSEGFPLKLILVGNIDSHQLGDKVKQLVNKINSQNKIVDWYQNISIDKVKYYYHDSDCFIFASSCENMPNILIEAMSSGLPIVCSNLGPMKEFLKDSGIYFNPMSSSEIKSSLKTIIVDQNLRTKLTQKSYKLSLNYSWKKCSKNTISYIIKNSLKIKNI